MDKHYLDIGYNGDRAGYSFGGGEPDPPWIIDIPAVEVFAKAPGSTGNATGGSDYLVYDWGAMEGGRLGTQGTLNWYNSSGELQGSWSANSGGRNYLAIPSGEWTLSNYRGNRVGSYENHGIGFSVDVTPDPIWGRSLLRIHPDGGPYGTAGCIGLTCGASGLGQFSNMIQGYLNTHGIMPLYVTGYTINMGEIIIRP